MHNESMILALVLGGIGLVLINSKNKGVHAVGICVAAVAGLFAVAGLSA